MSSQANGPTRWLALAGQKGHVKAAQTPTTSWMAMASQKVWCKQPSPQSSFDFGLFNSAHNSTWVGGGIQTTGLRGLAGWLAG